LRYLSILSSIPLFIFHDSETKVNQGMWIDNFGDYIGRQREVPDTLKKTVLKSVLDHITVDYDHQEKLHRLYIRFRIPVFYGVNGKENGKSGNYLISRPLETLGNRSDQNSSVETYSTVTVSPPMGREVTTTLQGRYKPLPIGQGVTDPKDNEHSIQTGHSLVMDVEVSSSNLWVSPYTPYQQELFDLICKLHDTDGWDFKRISDWLNGNGYWTTRGKIFRQNHVWSIYTKKHRSIKRFSREYPHTFKDVKIDSVDYLPGKE